jgi:hypothetical protein
MTRWLLAALALSAGMAFGQTSAPLSKPERQPPDISAIDPRPPGVAELAGAYLALGSQRINGNLRRPLVDYSVRVGSAVRRVSFFEGGLVCLHMTGAGGVIQKKLLIPDDSVKRYLAHLSAAKLNEIPADMFAFGAADKRTGILRIYSGDRFVERRFDPSASPKAFSDLTLPLEDLLRAVSEDSRLLNRIAGYEPHIGDHLVSLDQSTYEVVRIFGDDPMIELRGDNQPTTIYVAKKDLHNHFIGSRRGPSQ